MFRKILKYGAFLILLLLIASQFIQPDRTNPPENPLATFEAVAKPSPEVAAIVKRACRDCHSYTTVWPWYSRVAPVSWLLADHVKEGRQKLNFSEWNMFSPEMSRLKLKKACSEVKAGEMPIWNYRLIHPESRLSAGDVESICSAAVVP